MRLLVAMLALIVAFAPLVPSTVADNGDIGEEGDRDGEDKGCRIDTTDPTKPAIYGDCIIWGGGIGVGDTMSVDGAWATADVTVVTPATIDCDALCDRMIEASIDVETQRGTDAPTDATDTQTPLGAYVTATLDVPQGEADAGMDEEGLFAGTILTPFQQP